MAEMMQCLTASDLARIAAGASSPAERLGKQGGGGPASARLAAWCDHVGKGDTAIFERVLGWRGMEPGAWAAALATPDVNDLSPNQLPAWIAELNRMLEEVERAAVPTAPAYLDRNSPLPREAQFVCFVEAAAAGPRGRLADLHAPPAALAKLERRLLTALTEAADATLTRVPDLDFPRGVFLPHPVLARLLTRCWVNWIDAVNELLQRLEDDRPALAAFLGVPELAPLQAFSVEDADSHDGGRMVTVVQFQDGLRAVYKPRDTTLDAAFAGLIDWLTAAGLDLVGAVPRTLVRPGYGWAEFVAHRYAADDAELSCFWSRAGTVLGVLTALGGTDMHFGNVIAVGDHLAVVDLETVLRPPLAIPGQREAPPGSALARVGDLLEASALNTAMLPCITHRGEEIYSDIGALSAPSGNSQSNHRPASGPVEAELLRFHDVLVGGFVSALRLIRQRAPELLAHGSPLDAFAGAAVRLVFRDTAIYVRLKRLASTADSLRDGADHHVALERLSRTLAPHRAAPAYVGIVSAEQRALSELDIPRFQARVEGVDLLDAEGVVAADMFVDSALAEVRRRLASLQAGDEAVQRRIVGLSVATRLAGCQMSSLPLRPPARPADAIQGARAIADALADVAIRGRDGGASWICPRHDPVAGYMTVSGFNPGLGEGTLGIAVFLAALANATGDPATIALRDAALAAIEGADDELADYRSLAAPSLGLAEGIGGRVWGYTALARLGGPAWCLDAAAAQLERGLAARPDGKWALADGASGLLLAGLALRSITPAAVDDAPMRTLARRCAELVAANVGLGTAGLFTGLTGAGLALARTAWHLDFPALRDVALPALLVADQEGSGSGWGKGAAGGLLARRGALAVLPGAEALAERLHADADSLAGRLDDDEALHACDGIWRGRAGVMAALRASERPGALERAEAMMAELAGHAVSGDLKPIAPALPGVLLPGMLNGVAGIGLVLLRDAGSEWPDPILFT